MKKLVIFDLDGTLMNSIDDIRIALNIGLSNANLDCYNNDEVKYMVGSGVDVLIRKAIKDNSDYFDSVKASYLSYYKDHNKVHTSPYQGIYKLLRGLKTIGLKLAVLSNKPDSDTKAIIDYFFKEDLFDVVLGKTDRNNLKPSSDGVIEILDTLGVSKEETLYVGDTSIDIATATNSGIDCISVLWGFRKKEELVGASYYANSPSDIINIVSKINNLEKSGIIVLNKEQGMTSQDALIKVKKVLQDKNILVKKIGHAGTLDPLATGVLIVLVNDATKISDYLMEHDKEYECKVMLGLSTDTEDNTGKVIDRNENIDINESMIDECLKTFVGDQKQLPPMYSSIKKDGKKLYELARKGITIERDYRDISIYSLERISKVCSNSFSFKTFVSKGTYIRSLCRDIGNKLNTLATMEMLVRTKCGKYDISMAKRIDDLTNDNIEMIPILDALCSNSKNIERVDISYDIYKKVLDGKPLPLNISDVKDKSKDLALVYEERLVAIYSFDDFRMRAKRVWN